VKIRAWNTLECWRRCGTSIVKARDETRTRPACDDAGCVLLDAVDWSSTNKRPADLTSRCAGAMGTARQSLIPLLSKLSGVTAKAAEKRGITQGRWTSSGMMSTDASANDAPNQLQMFRESRQILEWEKDRLYLSSRPLISIVEAGVPDGYAGDRYLPRRYSTPRAKIIGMVTRWHELPQNQQD